MSPAKSENLRSEALHLHRQIFRREPTAFLVDCYLRAHAEIPELNLTDDAHQRAMSVIVGRQLDAAGIEPWLRGGPKRHPLSAKLLLIAYLAECDACHPEFSRHARGKGNALLRMVRTTAGALIRMLRGRIQKILHDIV
jgi:hypothetical protein